MAYDILNTCMLVPGVSQTNCAGWVQAWGSMIGLAIAIGVPWWQRADERRHAKQTEIAIATVVWNSMFVQFNNVVDCLDMVIDRWKPLIGAPEISIGHEITLVQLEMLVLPTETQLLQLTPVIPKAAISLALANALIRSVNNSLQILHRIYAGSEGNEETTSGLILLLAELEHAKKEFEYSKSLLTEKFKEGR